MVILLGCAGEKNALGVYLENVELQCEMSQVENIKRALNDALTLSQEELESKRYEDYTGTPGQWDLRILFENHFVPDDPGKVLGDHFYEDIQSENVQSTIRNILEGLTASIE